jgi:dihydropyrimidine dehydrogenase (NADP+)
VIKIDLNDDDVVQPAPTVNDVIGKALPKIGPYKKLDNKKQVVALIDDVSC